jgi:putative transposase
MPKTNPAPEGRKKMADTFTQLSTHIVFSTKSRAPLLDKQIRPRVFAYLGGIARQIGVKPLAIGGTADHVHVLLELPATISVADALRLLKTNSSRWIHQRWPTRRAFAWQAGYGAFSTSRSNASAVLEYVKSQERHHQKLSFQDEFRALLRRHGIPFDESTMWD